MRIFVGTSRERRCGWTGDESDYHQGGWRCELKSAQTWRVRAARAGVKRGPKPDTLKIEGDWQGAMKRSLQKKKPTEGWPK